MSVSVIDVKDGLSSKAHARVERAAVAEAERWLSMVDEGQIGKAWEHASEILHDAIGLPAWEESLRASLAEYGSAVARELVSKQHRLVGGESPTETAAFQFRTLWDKKRTPGEETLLMVLDKLGQWRVSGYFVKPSDPCQCL